MSWSVSSVGKPSAVKAALVKQFAQAKDNTKSMPHEHSTVLAIEQAVNAELDFLAQFQGVAVKVEGNGSAYINSNAAGDKSGSSQMAVSVQPLYGFVE